MNRRPARRGTRRKRHERSSACCHRGAVMTATPDPVWPVLVLALIQLVDAAPCVKPVGFVAACFEAVKWPRRLWWLMPWLKLAAVAGLIAGIFIPYLTAVTCSALILYFIVAISMHIRAAAVIAALAASALEW
jgi:hypothetical protein